MTNTSELSDPELAELDELLARVDGGKIPSIEALDGFFAALACCPDLIMPSEYMPILQRGETESGDLVFESAEDAQRFISLVGRHWNCVNDQLNWGDVYLPLILEDERSGRGGNDWANGFLTGTHLRHDIWAELMNDDEQAGPIVPILALAYEHHPDPEMRPYEEPIDKKTRDELLVASAAGVMRMHAYFLSRRGQYLPDDGGTLRPRSKVGRNAPCPCGSGKKYKQCCGRGPTVH